MSTAVATTKDEEKHPIAKLRDQLEGRTDEFRAALPAHMPPERFIRVVLTAVQNNPDLLVADRQSLWNSCMRAAQDGLLPDGREGAIVIFNAKVKINGVEKWIKKAQWMPMVFGILKKIRNSGQLAMITARVVCGGDKYRHWIDDEGEHVLYEPSETPDRNMVRVVFAAARTKDGEMLVEPLAPDEIERIRAASRSKDKGPWVDWWEEMAKKSAIRRLAKRLPMSSDLDDLVRRDDDLYQFDTAGSDQQIAARRPQTITAAFDHFAAGAITDETSDAPALADASQGAPEPAGDPPAEKKPAAAKPASNRKRSAPEPEQRQEPEPEAAAAEEKTGSAPAEATSDDPGAASDDDIGGDDDAGGDDEGWPEGKAPRNAGEYEAYVKRAISVATDAEVLRAWWGSADERKLRGTCGVIGEHMEALKANVSERYRELRAATAA